MAYQGAQSPNDRRASFDIKKAIRDLATGETILGTNTQIEGVLNIVRTEPSGAPTGGATLFLKGAPGYDSNVYFSDEETKVWRLHRDNSNGDDLRVERFVGGTSTDVPFKLSSSDGSVDFANRVRFNEKLELTTAVDVDLGVDQWTLKIGDDAGANLRIDNNEICALNNGAGGTLYLNGSGAAGRVETGGTLQANGPMQANNGTAGAPTHSFITDTNTGMYRYGTDAIGFSTAGTVRWSIGGSGNLIGRNSAVVRASYASSGAPTYSFDGDTDTGMYRSNTNELSFSTGGVQRMVINSGGSYDFKGGVFSNVNEIFADIGSQTDPSYTFDSNGDCGVYGGTDFVGLTTAGSWKLGCWSSYTRTNGQHRFDNGSAGTPSIGWTSDVNSGFYRPGTDQIGVTLNGLLRHTFMAGSDRLRFEESGTQRPYLSGEYSDSRAFYFGYPSGTGGAANLYADNNRSMVVGCNNSGRAIYLQVNAVTKGALDNTGAYFQEAYDATTSGDSYVKVSSTGRLRRHTSSVKYKRNVEPIDRRLGKQVLKDLDFIWFRSASPTDDSRHGFFGSTAESAAEKAPWLGVYEYPRECGCKPIKAKRTRKTWVDAGVYPHDDKYDPDGQDWEWEGHWREEEIEDERVEHTCGLGTPVGFDYSGLTAITASITEEQEERIDALEAELALLKKQIAGLTAGGGRR